jgi:hypothetical protein
MADNLAPAPRLGGKPGESNMANAAAGLPPATAAAAPTPATTRTGTGLCSALNAYYAEQAQKSGFIADVYEIYFADPLLENASMIPAGPIEKDFTGTTPLTSASETGSCQTKFSIAGENQRGYCRATDNTIH